MKAKQKILVTGVFGFLGWNIAHVLFQAGFDVLGIGRGRSRRGVLPAFRTVEMHLPDPQLDHILQDYLPDFVIHCASPASVPFSVAHPHSDFMQSAGALSSLLDSLRRNSRNVHFVLMSSASVYGNPKNLPVSEACSIQPISPYGYHKWISETLCHEYQTIHSMKTTIVRLFSAYGHGLRKQVVWDIFQKIRQSSEQNVHLFGTGEESRDFLHVYDVAKAMELLITHQAEGFFNLGSGKETTISELSQTICEVIDFQGRVMFNGEVRPGDPRNWRADIGKIKALGFQPEVNLRDGLTEIWKKLRVNES